jgi:hypothetical protein
MKQIAVVASRKFNPGHYSHVVATYKLLNDRGLLAFMLLHPSFRKMHLDDEEGILTNASELRRVGRVDLLVVAFPSLRALADIIFMRCRYRTRVVYIFHEPFESIKSYWNAGFRMRKTIRICLIGIINYWIVLLSNKVILPSERAESVFRMKYSHTQKDYAVVPLLFDDEAKANDFGRTRSYIAYIGTIAEDHAFDEFLKFVKDAIGNNIFPDNQYLIATGSSLSPSARAYISPLVTSGKLVLKEGSPLSNEEINDCYASSLVVWNAYKRSMQSGVLAKSYMFGTPLLVTSSNKSEFFVDRRNGVLISDKYDIGEIEDAIANIIEHFEEYSRICRRQFLDVFYYKAQSKVFGNFIFR